MTPLYQSRQIAWWLIIMVVVVVTVTYTLTYRSGETPPAWVFPVWVAMILPFSAMTLTVTREHLRVTFLLGLPRKTVKIEDIKSCDTYRAEGLRRLAVQIKPFQGQFQMSGKGGIVIVRRKGMPLTISDPEPEKLVRAVVRVGAKLEPPPEG